MLGAGHIKMRDNIRNTNDHYRFHKEDHIRVREEVGPIAKEWINTCKVLDEKNCILKFFSLISEVHDYSRMVKRKVSVEK